MATAHESKAFAVITLEPEKPRDVTPTDPLVINDVDLSLPWVRIVDGDIIAKVETKVNFAKLEKVHPAKGGKNVR
jgi:hypothetical protein